MSSTGHRHLLAALHERAQQDPTAPALDLIHPAREPHRLSAEELYRAVCSASLHLAARGVGPGDVVVVALGHGLSLVSCFLGAMHRGAAPVVFSSYLEADDALVTKGERLRRLVELTGAHAVITRDGDAASCRELLRGLGCRVLSAGEIATLSSARLIAPVAADIAFIQLTSGSAGPPKGIAQTYRRVARYVEAKLAAEMARPEDIVVSWLPLYHDLGLVSGLLTPLVLGCRAALISPSHWVARPAILLRTVSDLRATASFMPTFGLSHCARVVRDSELSGVDLSCWQNLVHGAEMVHRHSQLQFLNRFAPYGLREEALRVGYGMAELVEGATLSPRGRRPQVDRIERRALVEENRALPAGAADAAAEIVCCGRPFPGTEIRVSGKDDGVLGERQVGEIALRSEYMSDSYIGGRPGSALRDGWYRTGDLGYLADGSLYVTGRMSDLIIVGGRNLSPDAIEAVAERVEGVKPGRAVAFGVIDEEAGTERIVLLCEPSGELGDAKALEVERRLRRRIFAELDVALGEVQFVPRGWLRKTSSGKKARLENRGRWQSAHRDVAR